MILSSDKQTFMDYVMRRRSTCRRRYSYSYSMIMGFSHHALPYSKRTAGRA